jgi:hypothetical protein
MIDGTRALSPGAAARPRTLLDPVGKDSLTVQVGRGSGPALERVGYPISGWRRPGPRPQAATTASPLSSRCRSPCCRAQARDQDQS